MYKHLLVSNNFKSLIAHLPILALIHHRHLRNATIQNGMKADAIPPSPVSKPSQRESSSANSLSGK